MNAIARKLRLVDSYGITFFGISLCCALALALMTGAFAIAYNHDRKACEAKGGHLEQVGSHVQVISTGKSTTVTSVPEYACLDMARS